MGCPVLTLAEAVQHFLCPRAVAATRQPENGPATVSTSGLSRPVHVPFLVEHQASIRQVLRP